MNCSRSLSSSGARCVVAASILCVVVAAAVVDVTLPDPSTPRLLVPIGVKFLGKGFDASIIGAEASRKVLLPIVEFAASAAGKLIESESVVLTPSAALDDALALLVLALVLVCAVGCAGSALWVVAMVFQGPKVGSGGAAVVAADDVCPASVEISVSNDDGDVDGEAAAAPAPLHVKSIVRSPEKKQKKKVAFGPVVVREHKVIFGTGSCDGEVEYPLTLDWAHSEETVFDLDDHEEAQKLKAPMFEDPKKTRSRVLNTEERIERLCQVGDCRITTLELAEWQRIDREKQLQEELAQAELEEEEEAFDEECEHEVEKVEEDKAKKVLSRVKLEALEWKEEFRLQREFQESLRMELGELKEGDEAEDEEVEVAMMRPAGSWSAKKISVRPAPPVRRSLRLANKSPINYRE